MTWSRSGKLNAVILCYTIQSAIGGVFIWIAIRKFETQGKWTIDFNRLGWFQSILILITKLNELAYANKELRGQE